MTDGEKMVWAAVFAQEYTHKTRPDPNVYFGSTVAKENFYQTCLEEAIIAATDVIMRLRNEKDRIGGLLVEENAYNMIQEMLK